MENISHAMNSIFLPGITNDIKTLTAACETGQIPAERTDENLDVTSPWYIIT